MPVEYSVVERGLPSQPQAPKRFYAVARSTGQTTTRDLARRISDQSTVSAIDVMAMLEALFQVVPAELAAGRIVRCGEFGSFVLTLRGSGAATAQAFTPALIEQVDVKFRPGKLFHQLLQQADLQRVG